MAHVDVAGLAHALPNGRTLFDEVSFTVAPGEHVALIGANGAGKTTMLRLIAGDDRPRVGTITTGGPVGFMRQMVDDRPVGAPPPVGGPPARTPADPLTVGDLYLSLAPQRYRDAAARLRRAEQRMAGANANVDTDADPESLAMAYAGALAGWEELGGYDLEVQWAATVDRAVGLDWTAVAHRAMATFSGGEQKRLVLELLLGSEYPVLLLDEPDNFLDIPGKRWLAGQLAATDKTILFVSHDRALLADAADKLVTIEASGAWTHGGSFTGWADAREARKARLDDEHRRWAEERKRLVAHMRTMKQRAASNDSNASRARAAETRLRHFDQSGPPPEQVREQQVEMRLAGGRSGKRVVMVEQLELTDLTFPFDLELWYGDRIAVVGPNGTGKSHFLRLLAGQDVDHEGSWRLGARVEVGLFSQLHVHPSWTGRQLLDLLADRQFDRGRAMPRLRRYELTEQADQNWETLSGGQQARFQILLLEIDGANLLLLDEPTDNLDVASAEALEAGLAAFEGTVVAVSHDRWFLRSFDRFLVFAGDAEVSETDTWDGT